MSDPHDPTSKPPSNREDALTIVERLREHGHIAYFAGGSVRDMLLNIPPKDYDVATDAPPDRVRQIFSNTQAVGAAFGVILVRHGKSQIEVATFRTDASYEDGRRPTAVTFSTPEEDAKRRDFTINGLFFDPIENTVIDYVGGQEDLRTKTLRAIGLPELRFAEDHLRLLRAVRFAARFDLQIEPATAEAIRRHAEHLKRISPERIAEELRLMLKPASRVKAHRMLLEFGLERVILRFLPGRSDSAGSVAGAAVFAALETPSVSFGLALSAMILDARAGALPTMQDVRKASAAMRQALKISNQESEELEASLSFALLLQDPLPTVATLKRFLAQPYSNQSRLLMAAAARAGLQQGKIHQLLEKLAELETTDYAPPPLLTGDDLTAAGWSPGPVFKRVLDAVYDAQLENHITNTSEALQLAEELKKTGPGGRK